MICCYYMIIMLMFFYNKTDTDNLLSCLVTTDYLNLKYTNSVDLYSNSYNTTEVYATTDNTFEVQKIRAMSAEFHNIADAAFFYDGTMESYFEFIAPNIYNKTETDNMVFIL